MDDQHTGLSLHFTRYRLDRCSVMTPRIDLSRQDIADVVHAFYASVRKHDQLGPVFSKHVDDWQSHEEKITRFWANAIQHERSYDGNPMMAHLQARDVKEQHFEVWLGVFDATLERLIPSPQKEQWSLLAHRIGRGLSLGVSDMRRNSNTPPKF